MLIAQLKIPQYALCFCVVLICGCSSTNISSARRSFYAGNPNQAALDLSEITREENDEVLPLMERGMMYHVAQDHTNATRDWIAAKDIADELDYYSISKGVTSFVINDRVLAYRGLPHERTLMHSFAAQSYLALSDWDDAAVEARNIIKRFDDLNGFPDDPFSRYIAGFCMEMIDNYDAASRLYKQADALLPVLDIDKASGRFWPKPCSRKQRKSNPENELVCFVGIGRAPKECGNTQTAINWGSLPYAEIYAEGRLLGRSYPFTDVGTLLSKTEIRLSALQTAKDVARIYVKETIVYQVAEEDYLLAELIRLILYALETPDTRRWETLPRWLQVARVPCDGGITSYTVRFKRSDGSLVEERTIKAPITQKDGVYVSFCRAL